ncbi:MAG: transglutaminase-like domain-containing protein [Methanobrevibacter sp.]|nr:transglutaminase-like domain-containing protein [Methanobrevibacter sp.]
MRKKGILLIICLVFGILILSTIFLINFDNANSYDSNQSNKSFANNSIQTKELFSKYEGDSLDKYLISTKNAPSESEYIKELANQITKNKSTTSSKAEAIFDWVKKNIEYSGYEGDKYGGEGAIKNSRGNCVDTSHALVSLFRAEGIPARYVYGKCEFVKGNLTGLTVPHVWVQVLIDDEWRVADGIYEKNQLGYVSNWKTYSYNLYKIYPNL